MSNVSWTPQQHDAIYARGGTLLVSAAAGSGKTAVLAERVISIICDRDKPVNADKLLIVTFSRAAAAEMKQRISKRLLDMIRQNPADIFLQKQQSLLSGARISTVHSFCSDLIRQNFQHVNVAPSFKIMEAGEAAVLDEECLYAVIEEYYEQSPPAFKELLALLSSGRDDKHLRDTVYKLYEFSRSHPFYESWLSQKLAMYDINTPVWRSPWGKFLISRAEDTLLYCIKALEGGIDSMSGDERYEKAYLPLFLEYLSFCREVLAYTQNGEWNTAVKRLRQFNKGRLGAVRGDDPLKEVLKSIKDRCCDLIQGLSQSCLNATNEEYLQDIADLTPKLECLFELVKRYDSRVKEAKTENKKLYYSDLEHFALALLVDENGNVTEHAKRISKQYEYVLVDEFQDTNAVQDLIFRSVSQNEENLFMVGDVKQSIYSFRQAMPEIFIHKKNTYNAYDRDLQIYPAYIMLDKNFRSRSEVTSAVNYVFSVLMSAKLGGIDYDNNESLKCAAQYPQAQNMQPEFMLIDASGYSGDKSATDIEADIVAKKIYDMISQGFTVTEKDNLRPVTAGDICILMRSPGARAAAYTDALAKYGINSHTQSSTGFLSTREIAGTVGFLRALINPLLDIELISAMLSPLFDFTDDDIASVRLAERTQPVFISMQKRAQDGDVKCINFLNIYYRLKSFSLSVSAQELIQRLYLLTNALEAVSAMPLGESRRMNLLALIDYAASYHESGYKGIARFVGFINRLEEKGGDFDAAEAATGTESSVSIMSVHRSKGLEFPVVIIADTAHKFNKSDMREPSILHSELGFACKSRNTKSRIQYKTLPMAAIALAAENTLLSEELRILYVAMTRAREKLIITSLAKRAPNKLLPSLLFSVNNGKIPAFLASSVSSWSDWMIASLLHHPDSAPLREAGNLFEAENIFDQNSWDISVIYPDDEEVQEVSKEFTRTALPDEKTVSEVKLRILFEYGQAAKTQTPVKLSVSEIAKAGSTAQYRFAKRPKFMAEISGLTPAERGNAMHKFMQFCSYSQAGHSLSDEIERMYNQQFLTLPETESLRKNIKKIQAFFESQLAGRIFSSNKIIRELRFMAEFGRDILKEAIPQMDDESLVVVQGVADCVFIEGDGAVIVDYKTDIVKTMDELALKYKLQLEMYKKILSQSMQEPIKSCVLYSFHLGEWLEF